MLDRVNDRRVAGSPRLLELRRDLREDALSFYDQILTQIESNDPIVRADTARALREASELLRVVGDATKAEEHAKRALQLTKALRIDRPDDLELMSLEIDCLNTLGTIGEAAGKYDAALAFLRQALELAERVATALPDDLTHQDRLALCHNKVGATLYASRGGSQKRLRESRTEFQKAIKIRRPIDPRKLPGVTQKLVQTITNEGLTYWNEGNNSEAANSFRRAEELLRSDASDLEKQGPTRSTRMVT
jgi:tetratricopeptide (TPR) repeat protein